MSIPKEIPRQYLKHLINPEQYIAEYLPTCRFCHRAHTLESIIDHLRAKHEWCEAYDRFEAVGYDKRTIEWAQLKAADRVGGLAQRKMHKT